MSDGMRVEMIPGTVVTGGHFAANDRPTVQRIMADESVMAAWAGTNLGAMVRAVLRAASPDRTGP